MLTLSLRLTWMYRETCCENTSRNDQKLTKLCSDACFLKNIGKRQFFITRDEERPDDMNTLCREFSLPRNEEASRARGWIRGNTKIGPVLDVKLHFRQVCYCVGKIIESFFETEQFLGFAS